MMSMTALELRKNRLLFVGLAAAFVLSIPLGAWMGIKSLPSAMAGVHAALAFWCTLGLPGLAVLLGASAGAGLRSEPMAEAEALLPVSPRRRVFSALASSLLHAALLSGVVLLAAFILGPWLGGDKEWGRPFDDAREFLGAYLSLLGYGVFYPLAAAFAFAYLFAHGILGGLLGAVLGAAAYASAAAAFALRLFFPESSPWDHLPEAGMIASGLVVLSALGAAAPAIERRPRRSLAWTGLAGALAAAGASACALLFLGMWERSSRAWVIEESAFLGDWRGAKPVEWQSRAALVTDREGTVSAVTPEGRELVLVPGEKRPLRHLLDWPMWFPLRDSAWTRDGRLWVLRLAGTGASARWELIEGKPGEGFKTRLELPYDHADMFLSHRDGEIALMESRYDSTRRELSYRYALVSSFRPLPRWKPLPSPRIPFGVERVAEPPLAKLNYDLRVHARRRGVDDPARRPPAPPSFESPGGKLVPVRLKNGVRALAEFRKDGSLRHHWGGRMREDFSPWKLPDGTLWDWGADKELLILPRNGMPLPPVSLAKALAQAREERPGLWTQPWIIHREDGRLWLFAGTALLQIDESDGALLGSVALPSRQRGRLEYLSGFHVAEDGIFYHDGRSLYFSDWRGRFRSLRQPTEAGMVRGWASPTR